MEIRILAQKELESAHYVWSQAFERGDREMHDWKEWEAKFPENRVTFGVFDAVGLQATVLVVGYQVHFGPDLLMAMGGVCGVACLPAARGKGYAGAGVRYALEQMRQAGQTISILDPFHWGFYQKLGWDWIGIQRRYTVPTRVLKPEPETEFVRAATPADRPQIRAAYTQFAGRYRGMLARTLKDWDWMLDDREKEYTYSYLYAKEGGVEGYLTYRGGKQEETRLREFITLTPRAQRALLGLLRRHEMQVDKFSWAAPGDDRLWSQLCHWDIHTKLRPMTMGRIVDVPGALQLLKPDPATGGTVTFAVQDEDAPWNRRTWHVAFEQGGVTVEPATATPQVALDIRALSQAYFGTPALEELRAAERLTVHDEAGYAALRQLLDGPPMWINDDF